MGFTYTMLYIFEIKCGGTGLYLRGIGVLSPEISPYKYINKIEMLKIQCLGNHMKKQNF